MAVDTNTLIEFYLDNINIVLPAIAKARQWKIKHNHCFARIILDNVFDDCWYNHLDKTKVAYKQLNKDQLIKAFNIINLILLNDNIIYQLNNKSLKYRKKYKQLSI